MLEIFYVVPPLYSFIEENQSIISITEGSTKEIKFTATANPPLTDDTKHELTCLNHGVEVPATRRFTVSHNTIILNDVKSEDTGLYQISCKSCNGQIGKEFFELKILCKQFFIIISIVPSLFYPILTTLL